MAFITRRRLRRVAATPVVVGLVLAAGACSSGEPAATPGVTSTPCPGSANPDRGCLYLGVLSDLAGGPYGPLGAAIHTGQIAFWNQVNQEGGIGGYDVDVTTYARNTAYDPRTHRAAYDEIEPNVLALAMSFGTAQTVAMLNQMDADDMVSAAATQWSGWNYRSADHNLVLSIGYSYCTEAITSLDWFAEHQYQPHNIAVVGYRGNYGGDYAAGALKWAIANDATIAARIETGPNTEVGNQDGPVAEVLATNPDVVMLATGPAETAEIVGKLVKLGFTGRFLGSGPTWTPALLQSPAAPALAAVYNSLAPVDSWDGGSVGARRARAATDEQQSMSFGYTLGWAISYPMEGVLRKAAADHSLTRAGMRRAVLTAQPDGEGMVNIHSPGAVEPDLSSEWVTVFAPDGQSAPGRRPVYLGYQGKTLNTLDIHEPCTRL